MLAHVKVHSKCKNPNQRFPTVPGVVGRHCNVFELHQESSQIYRTLIYFAWLQRIPIAPDKSNKWSRYYSILYLIIALNTSHPKSVSLLVCNGFVSA